MSAPPRGLTTFIADLRNCRAREAEEKRINKELANIRAKFKDGNMSGYQKKKYVCKLLYIYILGWDIDIGHMEAINLLASTKYSEKQIGYLAVTLLLTENSDLLRMVVNSIRKDLEDLNEIFNCLALHAIANIGGREMAESLTNDVVKLLVSSTSSNFVKKKAALCLLRLFRKHQEIMPTTDWASRVIGAMDDHDMGVALSVTTLVLALAQQYPEAYSACVPKAINRLHRVIVDGECGMEYIYYKVPVPWLQNTNASQNSTSEDRTLRSKLVAILSNIINNTQEIPKNVQHNNATNAILFEAISLAIHIDPESDLVTQSAVQLGRFISSKETNIRYLGLETMAHLAGFADSLDAIKKHQDTVIQSLKDKDISVRRRALDLLYSMCDHTNSRVVVSELLLYLSIADYAIREEMVLKIAILTEKFATDYSWYVDIILQLITIAGDHVSDDIWYRVVQIVTNVEELQEYAAKTVLNTLKSPTCHENALKVGGYILGEFGHLIANQPGCSPPEQFAALHSKFGVCPVATRALLLTTYLKFVNLFPEIKNDVGRVFQQYRFVIDVELQQRACEYLAIASLPTDELLVTVCEEMPPFPERESALLSRLQKTMGDTEDKRTWAIGGRDANKTMQLVRRVEKRRLSTTQQNGAGAPGAIPNSNGHGGSTESDLIGLSLVAGGAGGYNNGSLSTAIGPSRQVLDEMFNKLVVGASGILYEDSVLQIGLKSEYHNQLGRIALFFGNKSTSPIANLVTDIAVSNEVKISLIQPIASIIPPASQFNQMYNIECLKAITSTPELHVSYSTSAGPNRLALSLPIVLSKFLSPVDMSNTDFFGRWKQIGGPPQEAQVIFKTQKPIDLVAVKNVLSGIKVVNLDGIDPNPKNMVGALIYNCTELGKVGTLLRLEPNLEQQVRKEQKKSYVTKNDSMIKTQQ
ncbi:hypothetical protein SmJEL517_g02852 [Synchytrium microbalum]|uniref:AP-2 complex subunit alpha n=1 Tax=Synchytrium microbalum TaxID=1806994 RepID=A0A507C4I5_9FUNG|nr:uncharacterized protein SmJEL517_g02852 [Synchytrium microbalum]TPX34582.1 hypothetical protein SmJEL517_g02852 [Synchytrium microbalum]